MEKGMMILMKKMSKLFCLSIFCLILCAGCDVSYQLRVDNNQVNESVTLDNYVINYDDVLMISPIETFSQQYSYSGFAISSTGHNLKKHFNSLDEFNEQAAIFDMIDTSSYIKIDGKKVKIDFPISALNTPEIANYGKIENLEISFYIPYFVSKNNADKVIGNTYTWKIDDFSNDKVIINFDISKPYDFLSKIFLIIFLIALAIGVIFVIKYVISRHKEVNRI